ncbi:hypothetical protein ACFZCY_26825 [Streptomyces sp. NPDC007983]|uniref:hypothetical protein n=1 Tax=Streptomyces sp. NPDC007983 TaxID=3364800 RepID=UPI0036EBD66D
MEFSKTAFEELIEKIERNIRKLGEHNADFAKKGESAANKWYIPGPLARVIIAAVNKLVKFINWVTKKLTDLFKGSFAPLTLHLDSLVWQDETVRGKASSASSNTMKVNLLAPRKWEGDGADSYVGAIWGQSAAAGRVSTSAVSISDTLSSVANAGILFYAAMGAFLVQFIFAVIAAAGTAATGIGIPIAVVTAMGEGAAGWLVVGGALAALAKILSEASKALGDLKGDSVDDTGFPEDGHWPSGTA